MAAMEKVRFPPPLQQVPPYVDYHLAVTLWSFIMEKHIPDNLNYFGFAAQDDVNISGAGLLALRFHCRCPEHLLFTNLWTKEVLKSRQWSDLVGETSLPGVQSVLLKLGSSPVLEASSNLL